MRKFIDSLRQGGRKSRLEENPVGFKKVQESAVWRALVKEA
jgi:hypothetical protein